MEGIKRCHGHLGAPGFHFTFRPASVQADGAGDVFRKGMTEIPFANEDIADEPASVHVEDTAGGLACGIGKTYEDFTGLAEFLTVIPSLRCVDLGMMTA